MNPFAPVCAERAVFAPDEHSEVHLSYDGDSVEVDHMTYMGHIVPVPPDLARTLIAYAEQHRVDWEAEE